MHDNQRKRFQRNWQLLLELEKQIARGHQDKERNADRVIHRWDAIMVTKPGGVSWTIPQLASCFKQLAKSQADELVVDKHYIDAVLLYVMKD